MENNTCNICGCTDNDCTECIKKTGKPCFWLNSEKTICSACLDIALDLASNFIFIMRKNEKDSPEEISRMIKLNYKRFLEVKK